MKRSVTRLVEEYYRKRNRAWISEVSMDLDLDLRDTLRAIETLRKKGIIKPLN